MTRPAALAVAAAIALWPALTQAASSLEEQNQLLFKQLQEAHHLSDPQMAAIRALFVRSGVLGQGNPAIVEHPMTPEQCRARLEQRSVRYDNPEFERICAARYMAPLYDPDAESPADARACIDQFEFPDIPCTYPVVWVRAREAAELCAAMGKRLCDAHEWEGACAGRLEPPDYRFDLAAGVSPNAAVERMRKAIIRRTRRTRPGATVRPIAPACAPPPATRAQPATAAAGRCAAPIPTRPAPFPTATVRLACTTSTATPPST
jgi:hypothetical protein